MPAKAAEAARQRAGALAARCHALLQRCQRRAQRRRASASGALRASAAAPCWRGAEAARSALAVGGATRAMLLLRRYAAGAALQSQQSAMLHFLQLCFSLTLPLTPPHTPDAAFIEWLFIVYRAYAMITPLMLTTLLLDSRRITAGITALFALFFCIIYAVIIAEFAAIDENVLRHAILSFSRWHAIIFSELSSLRDAMRSPHEAYLQSFSTYITDTLRRDADASYAADVDILFGWYELERYCHWLPHCWYYSHLYDIEFQPTLRYGLYWWDTAMALLFEILFLFDYWDNFHFHYWIPSR